MRYVALFCLSLALIPGAVAGAGLTGISETTIGDDYIQLTIELVGGIGADVEIRFEDVVGLSPADLGLSAELVDPLDVGLVARLPDPLVSIPTAFPVLLTIEPPSTGQLAFTGVVEISLHTHNLNYVTNSPLRLMAAPLSGTFQDMTSFTGMGSYRVKGTRGGFSEFLIVADLRTSASRVTDKFADLQGLLTLYSSDIPNAIESDLQTILDDALALYTGGFSADAAERISDFADEVLSRQHRFPNTWRAGGSLTNVAGELRASVATLQFGLSLHANGAP